MNQPFELIANKPWILIILGFVLLISVWITFFTIAVRNQPVKVDPQAAASFRDAPVLLVGSSLSACSAQAGGDLPGFAG